MKKLYLEFIRGTAAIIVLIYHSIEVHPIGIKAARHYYFSNWGTDAVMIFFILSGLVINLSETKKPRLRKAFIYNRLVRLVPQFLAGILLAIFALMLTKTALPNAGIVIGNLLMLGTLQGFIIPCLVSNSPLWSLSFEMLFYLLFMLSIGRYQKKAIMIWLLAAVISLPFYYLNLKLNVCGHLVAVLSFSTIWLVGYHVYQFRNYFYANVCTAVFSIGCLPLISRLHIFAVYYDPLKYLLFALFAVPFFRYCLQLPKAGKRIKLIYLLLPHLLISLIVFKQPYITFVNWLLYSGLPFAFLLLVKFIHALNVPGNLQQIIMTVGRVTGKYSYALYISHYPVLFTCAVFFPQLWEYLIISFSLIAVTTYLLETRFQPAIVSLFKQAFNRQDRPEHVY